MLRPWRQAFDFRGRAARREYWLFLGQLYAAMTIIFLTAGLLLSAAAPGIAAGAAAGVAAGLIATFLLFLIPYLSASVRRLHDHDKSGWLFLLTFIPLVGWIFFLIMMLTPGTRGENGYGPDPRDRLEAGRDVSRIFS
jgi:uncharacterized membrane protein YhaH (DUF805 family)